MRLAYRTDLPHVPGTPRLPQVQGPCYANVLLSSADGQESPGTETHLPVPKLSSATPQHKDQLSSAHPASRKHSPGALSAGPGLC